MDKLECRKCGYTWVPRKETETIKTCPSCKTRKWRKEIKIS